MTAVQFHNLENAVGTRFLEYVLNYEQGLVRHAQIEEYAFTGAQTRGAIRLLELLGMCYAQSPGFALSSLSRLAHEFNVTRVQCGGALIQRKRNEALLNYLLKRAVESYTSLLLKEDVHLAYWWGRAASTRFVPSLAEEEFIAAALREHGVLRRLLRGQRETHDARVEFTLSNSIFVSSFLFNFVSDFLTPCFAACCYRGRYDIQSFLDEVEASFERLVAIAEEKEVEAYYFHGLRGVRLDDVNQIDLSDQVEIRNIDELSNPMTYDIVGTGGTDERQGILLGCIVEFRSRTKGEFTITEQQRERVISWSSFEQLVDNIVTSTILSVEAIRAPVRKSFTDICVPLYRHFSHIERDGPGSVTLLRASHIEKLKYWFALLCSVDIEKVHIPLQRVRAAMYNRNDPVDSMLDFFIAWESMFSSDVSTNQSVWRSMEEMMKKAGKPVERKRLKQLYGTRSKIVHGTTGSPSTMLNPAEAESMRDEVATIALTVLAELLKDDELWPRAPNERVKHLLRPTSWACASEGCDARKWVFKD